MKKDYTKITTWILIGIITLILWGSLANWLLGVL
jgi:hypothetical protein